MTIVKLLIWAIMFPSTLFAFTLSSVFHCIQFLFNSPVDVWNIIDESIDQALKQ